MIDHPSWAIVRAALAENTEALGEFRKIEADVEKLVKELEGNREAERQLRQALEEPAQSTFQRR